MTLPWHHHSVDSSASRSFALPGWWRDGEAIAARELKPAIDILSDMAELMMQRLGSEDCGRNEDAGIALDLAVRAFVSEALSKLDAVIALLTVGCFDQVEPILRSLHELVVDLYLIIDDDDAFDSWSHWQTVEAAVLALKMDPGKPSREGRDLPARREELAADLRLRLRLSHPTGEANIPEDADLETVLRRYSKLRTGRGFPGSWRSEYQHLNEITREALIAKVAKSIWDVTSDGAPVLLEGWELLRAEVEAQFGPMYSYWSGETHNSPMSIARKIDPRQLTTSVHGSVEATVAPIGGVVLQMSRVMAVFERAICASADLRRWEVLVERIHEWSLARGPSPLPFWFVEG